MILEILANKEVQIEIKFCRFCSIGETLQPNTITCTCSLINYSWYNEVDSFMLTAGVAYVMQIACKTYISFFQALCIDKRGRFNLGNNFQFLLLPGDEARLLFNYIQYRKSYDCDCLHHEWYLKILSKFNSFNCSNFHTITHQHGWFHATEKVRKARTLICTECKLKLQDKLTCSRKWGNFLSHVARGSIDIITRIVIKPTYKTSAWQQCFSE